MNVARKNYIIPNLYRKMPTSSGDSIYDHLISCLTPPERNEVKKDTRKSIPVDFTNLRINIVPLPPRGVQVDNTATKGFCTRVDYNFPHAFAEEKVAFNEDDQAQTGLKENTNCLLTAEGTPVHSFPSFDSSSESWGSEYSDEKSEELPQKL